MTILRTVSTDGERASPAQIEAHGHRYLSDEFPNMAYITRCSLDVTAVGSSGAAAGSGHSSATAEMVAAAAAKRQATTAKEQTAAAAEKKKKQKKAGGLFAKLMGNRIGRSDL